MTDLETIATIATKLQNLRGECPAMFEDATDAIWHAEQGSLAKAKKALDRAEREIAKELTVLVGCEKNDEARDLYRAAEQAGLSLAAYPVSELIED